MPYLSAEPSAHVMDIMEGRSKFVPATMGQLRLIAQLDKESSRGEVFDVEKDRFHQHMKNLHSAKAWVRIIRDNECWSAEDAHRRSLQRDSEMVDLPNVLVAFPGELSSEDFCGICRGKFNELQDAAPCFIKHPLCSCRGQIYCRDCITTSFKYSTLCPLCRAELKGRSPESMAAWFARRQSVLNARYSAAGLNYRERMDRITRQEDMIVEPLRLLNQTHQDYVRENSRNRAPILQNTPRLEQNDSAASSVQLVDVVSQSFLDTLTKLATSTRIVKRAWAANNTLAAEIELRHTLELCATGLDHTKRTSTFAGIRNALESVRKQSIDALAKLSNSKARYTPLNSFGMERTPEKSATILASLEKLILQNSADEGEAWINAFHHDIKLLMALNKQSNMPENVKNREEAVGAAKYSLFIIVRRVSQWLEDTDRQKSSEIQLHLQDLVENSLKTLAITDWNRFRLSEWPHEGRVEEIFSNGSLFSGYKKRHLLCRIHDVVFGGHRHVWCYTPCSTTEVEEMVAYLRSVPEEFI